MRTQCHRPLGGIVSCLCHMLAMLSCEQFKDKDLPITLSIEYLLFHNCLLPSRDSNNSRSPLSPIQGRSACRKSMVCSLYGILQWCCPTLILSVLCFRCLSQDRCSISCCPPASYMEWRCTRFLKVRMGT